jgi:transcriptional regulator with XRE-family HTH domain|nr:helix-turn-helix transcriptional regulator [uncultured Blautia sp.]
MTIGKRIREVRLQNDMSLRDFAKLIGVSDTTVMKWEKDERKMSFENAIKICDQFDVKLSWLAGLED